MNDETLKLDEGVHNPLVTPEFTGTDTEILASFNYWTNLVNVVRALTTAVADYANKEAIISHLEREVALLRTELENVSAVMVPGEQPGVSKMSQPLQGPDAKQQADIEAGTETTTQDKIVDLSLAAEDIADKARRVAGISKKVNLLARAFKNIEPLPDVSIIVERIEPTEAEIQAAALSARKLAGLPLKRA